MQTVQRFAPEAAIDQIIPLRDEVVNGAARGHPVENCPGVAEWDTAVHTAGALLAQSFLVQVQMELFPVPYAVSGCSVERQLAQIFNKPCGFSHM